MSRQSAMSQTVQCAHFITSQNKKTKRKPYTGCYRTKTIRDSYHGHLATKRQITLDDLISGIRGTV